MPNVCTIFWRRNEPVRSHQPSRHCGGGRRREPPWRVPSRVRAHRLGSDPAARRSRTRRAGSSARRSRSRLGGFTRRFHLAVCWIRAQSGLCKPPSWPLAKTRTSKTAESPAALLVAVSLRAPSSLSLNKLLALGCPSTSTGRLTSPQVECHDLLDGSRQASSSPTLCSGRPVDRQRVGRVGLSVHVPTGPTERNMIAKTTPNGIADVEYR
jgi:hypothetical protein